MRVVIIGAGYVGLTLGVVAAESGHDVELVEKDEKKLKLLENGKSHFYEPGIDELLLRQVQAEKLRAVATLCKIRSPKDDVPVVYVISLGTPFEGEKGARFGGPIHKIILEELQTVIRDIDVLCLRSTVQIGFCDGLLDAMSRKINIAFCPERTVEGNALNELLELPQIIATNNEYTFELCKELFKFSPNFIRLHSFREGEAVKLVCNTYRDWTFSFANMCALIALEKDISIVRTLEAANTSYPRNKIPMPGLVGGPCLEKDPLIFSSNLSEPLSEYVKTSRKINDFYFRRILSISLPADAIDSYKHKRAVIVGAAFKGKPITNDTRGSLIYPTIEHLLKVGFRIANMSCFDPVVKEIDNYPELYVFNQFEKLFSTDADYYLIMTNHQIFYSSVFEKFVRQSGGKVISFWPELVQ